MDSNVASAWPLFVGVIFSLCLFASWWALRHTRRYNTTETKALEYVADKLKRSGEPGTPEQSATAPLPETTAQPEAPAPKPKSAVRQLVSIASLLEGLSKESLIADRLDLIERMRGLQVKVSVSALQEMTLAREASAEWLSLPSYAASLSMMLGLLGTVVGLALMVQQIDLGLSKATMNSWAASISQMSGVLAGMKTAFVATMAGISSAIVLSFLNHRLGNAQSAFLERLDRFTTEDLLPATVAATEGDSLLERVSLQLDTSFGRLDEIVKSNQDTLLQLNSVEKGFIEIVGTIRDSTKAETSERIHSLIGQTSGIIAQVAELNQSMVTVAASLPAVVNQVAQANQAAMGKIDQLIRSYEGRRTQAEEANMGRIDRLIHAYEEQRSLMNWPLQVKVVFGFMALLNLALIGHFFFNR